MSFEIKIVSKNGLEDMINLAIMKSLNDTAYTFSENIL